MWNIHELNSFSLLIMVISFKAPDSRKMYNEALMVRKVKAYLNTIQSNEESSHMYFYFLSGHSFRFLYNLGESL